MNRELWIAALQEGQHSLHAWGESEEEGPVDHVKDKHKERYRQRLEGMDVPWRDHAEKLGDCQDCGETLYRVDLWFTGSRTDPTEGAGCHRCGSWKCTVDRRGETRCSYSLEDTYSHIFDVRALDDDCEEALWLCGWCEERQLDYAEKLELPVRTDDPCVYVNDTVVYDYNGLIWGHDHSELLLQWLHGKVMGATDDELETILSLVRA